MNDEAQREQRLSELAHQFSTLVRQGAHPSVEEFASANPDFAVEIRDLFPSLSLLEDQSKHPLHSLPPIPDRLGDFTITRKIGQGGMGQVFEATQESLGRRVALKVLTVLYSNANAVARFSREAQIVSRLHHTNIVPIYSFGESNGVIYYAMQFIDGWSLDRIVGDYDGEATSKKKLIAAPHRVARLGIEAASALAEAHACGVTHRDVKPANMLLDRTDKLWLTDFGLAQLQEVSDLTGPDDMLGTMRYMPPERLSGNSGKLGDIYGLGISLYEILAGRPAYLAKDRSQLMNQILNEAPPRIETLNGSVPIDLATIVHKCIAKPPGDRYQSAWELQEDLVRYSADLPIRARRLSPFGIAMRWAQRNRLLASALATAVAALAVVAIISTTFLVRENHYSRTLEFAIKETDKAKQGQLEEVYHNLVDAARAKQLSFRPGQRFESLNDLQAASKLLDGRLQLPDTQKQARIAELRDLAVSALTLIDVRNVGELANEKKYSYTDLFRGDRYFYQRDATTVVCRNFANEEIIELPNINANTIVLATPDPMVVLLIDRDNHQLLHRRIDEQRATLVADSSDMALEWHVAEFSRDGTKLLLRSYTEPIATVNLFDWPTGKQLLHLTDLYFGVQVHLSPDGSQVALRRGEYGDEECKMSVIDVATGVESTLAEFEEFVESMAWYPDSKTIAIGLTDSNTIEWWDVPGRKMLRRINSQRGGGPALAGNTTGEWLYSYSGWSNQAMLWTAFSDTPRLNLTSLPAFLYPTGKGDFLGGRTVVEGTYQIWEAVPSHVVRNCFRHPAHGEAKRWFAAAVHPGGRIMAVGSDNGVSIFDLSSGLELQCLDTGQCNYPYFVPQTGDLLTNSKSGLHRWKFGFDPQTNELVDVAAPELLPGKSAFGMRVVSDNTGQIIANAYGKKVFVIRGDSPHVEVLEGFEDCRTVSLSPDGRWLLTAPHGGTKGDYAIWNTSNLKLEKSFPRPDGNTFARFSHDGQWLSTFDGGVIHVGDWRRDPDLSRLRGRFHVFSHDSRLVLSFDNGQVVLQDTASGERMCSLTMPQSYNIDDWIFTPDDHFAILSSNQDLTTYVWDLRALKMELKALGFGWKSEVIPDPTSTLGEAR